ncbi:MAG TPA: histidinol-phosphate transaminase [Thermomicrobiaceae bacterium]|nr:histidinol-phosphate transaminase [Thermomicrobiaceae bacterium]
MSKSLDQIIRPAVREAEGYQPSEPVERIASRIGKQVHELIRLDLNENPYGTSFRVQEALASFDNYHRYPDADQTNARRRLAKYASIASEQIVSVAPERIILSNGADEAIDMLMMATIDPGDEVIIPEPTFGVYRERPPLFGGVARIVPRSADFGLDVEAIERAITPKTKLMFITSPNNPTGNLPTHHQIVRLLHTGIPMVLDEAYYEFCGKTYLPLSAEFDNMIVMRTLSKWAGLAGMRLGYTIFPLEFAQEMWKVKQPFNVSAAGLLAIDAVLDDQDYLLHTVARIRVERSRLFRQLRKLNFLQPFPSQGNFILCQVTRGDAHDIHRRLGEQGIIIRKYFDPMLRDYLRISVGKPEDTDALMSALLAMAPEI